MTIHVVGAGLAGLSTALQLARRGEAARVTLHEAAAQAGGRCRSWHDARLGTVIDNGTHVVVGANVAVQDFLGAIDARDRLHWFDDGIAFRDPTTGTTRRVSGPRDLAGWARAAGGSVVGEALAGLRLAAPLGAATIAVRYGASVLANSLWDPLARSVMNTVPREAAAAPFARVLRRTLGAGAQAMRVAVARDSLDACFVAPALASLRDAGATLAFGARLQRIDVDGDRIAALQISDRTVTLGDEDRVVLALPPWEHARLLPMRAVAHVPSPIVNFHVRLPGAAAGAAPALLGLIGRTAEWLLVRGDIASVTVSAADALVEREAEEIAATLWADVALALELEAHGLPPAWRVIKERRATPRQDPAFEAVRPGTRTPWRNLVLAGDWVEPGLPCTIETAIASGTRAAAMVMAG